MPKKQNKKTKIVKHKPKAKINKKTKKKSFFKKRKIRENIFKDDKNQSDEDFSEEKVFSNSFFYKTHLQWNSLPFELKNVKEFSNFESKLKFHMWNLVPGLDNEEGL